MNVEELQSQTIRWMRFPLAVAIVYSHNLTWELQQTLSPFEWSSLSITDLYHIVCTTVSGVLARIARPCFFIFSGFLFFNNIKEWNKQTYFKKIKSRIKTLVVPYLLWNSIAVIVVASYYLLRTEYGPQFLTELWENGILKIFWNYHAEGGWNDIFGVAVVSHYPFNATMWFIRDLILLIFLSPLIYYFLKYSKLVGVIILGFGFYALARTFSNAIFFFCIGAYFSIHGKNMIIELRKWKIFWFIIAAITMLLSIYYKTKTNFLPIFIVTGAISTIIIVSGFIEKGKIDAKNKVVTFFAKTSFFIFATHTVLLLEWSRRLVDVIIKFECTLFLIIKYLATPLVCVSICVGLYYAANKISPKIMNVLTGSR
ncbi:MAG: acyltransferase [Marinilabiliaceae bacterium]|nr:acyltransferase [Marinilabiliaceae bacterium]